MRETKSKKLHTEKGITLIALVITIIVMLILVGVTISMALNGGLFGYAKKAIRDTESQKQAEQELTSGKVTVNGKEYASTQDYLDNKPQLSEYSESLLDETTKVLKENARYTSDGKTAIVPKGFTIVADENEEKSIAEGLIITDKVDSTGKSIGNEYVWVPVEDGTLDRTEWRNNEPTGTISDYYTETLPKDLINSVKTNKGFYIGRYEAGSNDIRTEATKDTLTEVLIKKGLYPYNYISQTNAINKIGEMYTNKEIYGVEAVLTYGAMWDETMEFIHDTYNVSNSKKWGNYKDALFKFTGKYCENPSETTPIYVEAKNIDKPVTKEWLLTTGASEQNKAKNIYDLAGNVIEWTQEATSSTNRVHRGGFYTPMGGVNPASYRNSLNQNYTGNILGFRPALYIK